MHRSMLVVLTTMLALASCGGEKPTAPEALQEVHAEESERINDMASLMSSALENTKPDAAQTRVLAEMLAGAFLDTPSDSGNAQLAPPVLERHLDDIGNRFEVDLDAFFEKYEGRYPLAFEQIYDNNNQDVWFRSFEKDEPAGELWIVPASKAPLGDNEVDQLREAPALMVYDEDGRLQRSYAVFSIEKTHFILQRLPFYWLGCIMFKDGMLTAHHVFFAEEWIELEGELGFLGLAAFNPFWGFNSTYWRQD